MTQNDFTASAEDRSRFFWWLAEWFLSPPTHDQLASLPTNSTPEPPADAMDSAWLALANAASNLETTPLNELGVEFTRLISGISEGSGPPPPFESVWREDRLIGESTVAVLAEYAAAGFADIDPAAGPQDHISVELKYIALLALREAEAWQAEDTAGAQQRLAQQRNFLRVHLSAWAPRWADAVIQHAQLPLFAALADLLKAGLGQAVLELSELTRKTG
jgi:putative dimethyl sulfoxide reductase chaperone